MWSNAVGKHAIPGCKTSGHNADFIGDFEDTWAKNSWLREEAHVYPPGTVKLVMMLHVKCSGRTIRRNLQPRHLEADPLLPTVCYFTLTELARAARPRRWRVALSTRDGRPDLGTEHKFLRKPPFKKIQNIIIIIFSS
jgi:hypothetical protein